MNINEFLIELQKLNIEPTKEQLSNLEKYKNLLIEYNQKFNLTAITKENDIYLKHFYDSLTLTKTLDLNKELNLLDIGTGAGFPGLVLKIFFPKLNITLLDSNNKKITFLNTVIKELNLNNIICINKRAEELQNLRETFDVVTSRAVAHLRILSELAIPLLKVNGLFIPLKGDVTLELAESKSTITTLNSELISTFNFKLPIENSTRTILIIKKNKATPSVYPRPYDKIKKKSL